MEWKRYMTTFLEDSEESFPDIAKLGSICIHDYDGYDVWGRHAIGMNRTRMATFGEPVS